MKKIGLLFLIIFSFGAKGSIINDIVVSCDVEKYCQEYEEKFSFLVSEKIDHKSIAKKMDFLLLDASIGQFHYKISKVDDVNILNITLKIKKIVRTISFQTRDKFTAERLSTQLVIKEGDFFDAEKVEESKEKLVAYLKENGALDPTVDLDFLHEDKALDLIFKINFKDLFRLEDVKIDFKSEYYTKQGMKRFSLSKGNVWDKSEFVSEVNAYRSKLVREGYLYAKLKFQERYDEKNKKVFIKINGDLGPRITIYFEGNVELSTDELKDVVVKYFKSKKVYFEKENLIKVIQEKYQEKGRYQTRVDPLLYEGKDKDNVEFKTYVFKIKEGHKIKLSSIKFGGLKQLRQSEVQELFYTKGSDLITSGYYDEQAVQSFKNGLLEYYHEKGFLFAQVSEPMVTIESERANLFYRISEKFQTMISEVKFNGIDKSHENECLANMKNKQGLPINVLEIESDIKDCLDLIKEYGYFFADITNKNVLRYHNGNREVNINVQFALGKKAVFDSVLITGHKQTKYEVFLRGIDLKKGELITPKVMQRVAHVLNSMGLFSSVKIIPYIQDRSNPDFDRINLLVQVKEKEFGQGIIAPGYRTDLGAKLSTTVSWNNIYGLNKSLSFNFQVNQRFNFRGLDERRRGNEKSVLEYSSKVLFNEPYFLYNLFNTKIQWQTSTSAKRKRFSSYDADILEFNTGLSKQFFNFLTTTLNYELELVSPFDATNEKDRRDARIGSITSAASFDFRNSPVVPTKGVYFSLSLEYASPSFYSLKDDEQEINYYKLVSRNKYYVPVGPFVLATSLAMGVQGNLAKDPKLNAQGQAVVDSDGVEETIGFIPSIKVFSLSGIDQVRGYSDDEINRLSSGIDIDKKAVRNKAFFANFKVEPRYYMDDKLAVGLFLDMGRVYIDKFEPLDLRMGSGLSFKFLTPVGALELSYGVKLKRENDAAGRREGIGRIHLSIGDF